MDEIRRGVVLGTLAADRPLPSVRQLAGELRVNPNTVQQAYRELERHKIVYVRRGQGTFVTPEALVSAEAEKVDLALGLARRALNEAYRSGLTGDELVAAIRRVENEQDAEES